MLEALKKHLKSLGYTTVCVDTVPAPEKQRDVIALMEWEHTVGAINDGTGVHYIQIQVRRGTYAEAHDLCRDLFMLLDSGPEETLIELTEDVFCIARPRRGPVKLESSPGYTTFYFEVALWGMN